MVRNVSRLTAGLMSVIAAAVATLSPAAAQDDRATKAVFESRHLELIPAGSEVTYVYEKKGSDERLVGKNFEDNIRLGVTKVAEDGKRDITFKVFTGNNARDPQAWPDFTINPLFIWYLDRSVESMAALAGGNQNYFKQRVRETFAKGAPVEDVKVDYEGKQVSAMKIEIVPFATDTNIKKMQGFENTKFTIILSPEIPGYFYDLATDFKSTAAAGPNLNLHIKLATLGPQK